MSLGIKVAVPFPCRKERAVLIYILLWQLVSSMHVFLTQEAVVFFMSDRREEWITSIVLVNDTGGKRGASDGCWRCAPYYFTSTNLNMLFWSLDSRCHSLSCLYCVWLGSTQSTVVSGRLWRLLQARPLCSVLHAGLYRASVSMKFKETSWCWASVEKIQQSCSSGRLALWENEKGKYLEVIPV